MAEMNEINERLEANESLLNKLSKAESEEQKPAYQLPLPDPEDIK